MPEEHLHLIVGRRGLALIVAEFTRDTDGVLHYTASDGSTGQVHPDAWTYTTTIDADHARNLAERGVVSEPSRLALPSEAGGLEHPPAPDEEGREGKTLDTHGGVR